ncbi:MAG TPA: serine/threonine-protein kinase [Gemmataceae bacterium]|nr:serine/threonine-protein kinase [Gemmataceae bacterium]
MRGSPALRNQSMDALNFVTELRACGLLEDARLERSVRELSDRSLSAPELARELVRRRLLTLFQARRLLNGKGSELVLGPYRLLLPINASGRVFKAIHGTLGRRVAVKLLPCPPRRKVSARARFERETALAARLGHPNLVTALDAFEKDGLYVLVTEWVSGADLGQHVRHAGPLSIPTACGLAIQAALALQHAHDRGLIHQRIEPANLLIAEPLAGQSFADFQLPGMEASPPVKVLNFGQTWAAAAAARRHNKPLPQPVGAYLAPEQRAERPNPDHRTDLYSLGGCLYLALTGRPPFAGGGRTRQPVPAPPLEEMRPEVPSRLAAVVRRLLALRPAERFDSAADLADVLVPFCAGSSLGRASSASFSLATTLSDLRARSTAPVLSLSEKPLLAEVTLPPRNRHRALKLIAGAMGLGLAAALAIHLFLSLS